MSDSDLLELKRKIKNEIFDEDKEVNDSKLLQKIHFLRKKENLGRDFAKYLWLAYRKNKDIRFFNELLWIESEKKTKRLNKAKKVFFNQLKPSGTYKFCYNAKHKSCLSKDETRRDFNTQALESKSICLIGTPLHFIRAYRLLIKKDINLDIINVKYHPNKRINSIINSKVFSYFYRLIFRKCKYFEIDINSESELKELELDKKYDIGFHKLSFIIPEKLFLQFENGLINDHWGALPLFKGRSTIKYSLLFGADLVATNHLIAEKIDTGEIISYTKLNHEKLTRDIYWGLGERIVKSLSLLANGKTLKSVDNTEGIVFYEMHPWLSNYVDENC